MPSCPPIAIDSQIELVSPRPMTCVGVGVDGGVNDVSDERDARASRLFFRGVTWSSTSLAFIDSKELTAPLMGDSVSVSSLMACLSHRFLAEPPALPGKGAAHRFSSSDWLPSPCGSGDPHPVGDLNEAKVEGLSFQKTINKKSENVNYCELRTADFQSNYTSYVQFEWNVLGCGDGDSSCNTQGQIERADSIPIDRLHRFCCHSNLRFRHSNR